MKQQIQSQQDPGADALDELAELAKYWIRSRARGRTPNGIRMAMIQVAREAIAYHLLVEQEKQRHMVDSAG